MGQLLVGKVHSLHFVSKCGVYTGVLLNLLYSDDTDPSFALDSKQDSAATHLCRFVCDLGIMLSTWKLSDKFL